MRFRLADSLVSCEHKQADSCKKQRLEKYLDSSGRSLMRACFGVSFVCSQGRIQEFLIGGWVRPNFGSERTVDLFVANFFLTETTTCFPICERRSPLAQEILLCEQRRTDHWRVPKNNYISEYPWKLVYWQNTTRASLS